MHRTVHSPEIAAGTTAHSVHLYEHETELVERAGGYLADALEGGAVAIVIATEAHRRAFESELEAAGIDLAEAFASGTLVSMDAAGTLAKFMKDGRIDPLAFRRVVGGLVRDAASTGRPVRAYGEMVALLWDAGDVVGAIELEELWNDLGRDLRFSLLCGYHMEDVSRPEHAEALRQVCELHGAVLGTDEVSGRFAPDGQSPRAARHLVDDALRRWGCGEIALADAALVCTELATNAVIHAGTQFSVVARRERSGIRIAVRDGIPAPPALARNVPAGFSGRGLHLVAALASSWGVELTGEGKTVWAKVRA